MPRALIFVDAGRRVLGCDARARAMLDSGSPIVQTGGRLAFVDALADARLGDALEALLGAQACRSAAGGPATGFVCRERAPAQGSCRVRLTRMDAPAPALAVGATAPQGCVLVELRPLSSGGAQPGPDPDLVALAWGLTRAQARVAVAIASGRTPAQVAREFGVTVRTIRSHLSGVYEALGLQGQLELARRLYAFPEPSGGGGGAEIVAVAGTPARRRR